MNVKLPSDFHRLAPFIAVAVLAVAGLVLVTRGISGGGGAGANADEVLDKAFSQGPKTAVVDLRARITAEVAGAPQASRAGTYEVSGPVEESTDPAAQDKADVRIRETGDGKDVNLRMISTGDRGYVRVGSRWYRLTPQQFRRVSEEDAAERPGNRSFVSGLGFDLERWMQQPRVAGSARLDGVDTHRITGDLDAAAMAADFAEQDTAGAGGGAGIDAFMRDAQKGGTVSLYVGKSDGILRKADVTASYTGESNERAMRLTFRFDLGIRAVNRPQRFVAPKSALPGSRLARLDPALLGSQADDLGLAQGKGTAPGTETSPGKDESSGGGSGRRDGTRSGRKRSSQAYINCVQQASDAAALQQCQALLPRR